MKTYDARMESIMKKARKRKRQRITAKVLASVLSVVLVVWAAGQLPGIFGDNAVVGVPPVNSTSDAIVPTTQTYVPTTQPCVPMASTVGATRYDFPLPDADRMTLIEETWAKRSLSAFAKDMKFCDPESGEDGIRYYGSFEKMNYNGQVLTYDILYIPCESLPVASRFTIGEYTLRSHVGFGLYVFVSKELTGMNVTMNSFTPLNEFIDSETGEPTIESDVLAAAAALHSAYECIFFGAELTELPEEDPADNLLRMKTAWLLSRGGVLTFNEPFGSRHYGSFSGYEIVFVPGNLTSVETKTIGGESFTYSSSFQLYAYKDWEFYKLKDVYDQGLITQEDISQLAKIHREWIYD